MDWNHYRKQFEHRARTAGLDTSEIDACLVYAKQIWDRRLPVIFDNEHLCGLVGFDWTYLYAASNAPWRFYRTFEIKKKSGGARQISEPLPGLKEIQGWILSEILSKFEPSPFAKAYCAGKSIRDAARFHKSQRMLLSLDIKDFFGNTPLRKVYRLFKDAGYATPVAGLLARLCCLDGALPQGAPTSPALSNIINKRMDARIGAYCVPRKIRYTRYADDLSFSGQFDAGELIGMMRKIVESSGYRLNDNKTRVAHPHQRQQVTGIVVNSGMHAPRTTRRKLRQAVYYIKKYGIDSHLEKTENPRANHVAHLKGVANFALFVNPNDAEAGRCLAELRELFPAKASEKNK